MNTNIVLTDTACTYIKKMLERDKGIALRLSIKKTGCSGYSYQPTIINTINAADFCVETSTGITIYIDPLWMHLLQDVCIDCVEDDKSGLKQKKLVFSNPKEASRCGCGESFQVK